MDYKIFLFANNNITKPMINIYLARHGQDEDNENGLLNWHRDRPLTKIGLEQATALAEMIRNSGIHFDKIYSSPLQRAYKTAWIIADAVNMDQPEIIEELKERDFGDLTGMKISEAVEMSRPNTLSSSTVEYMLYPENGETFQTLLERAKKVLEFIESKHTNGNILLVAHGDIGKMIYANYYKIDRKEVLQWFHFWNAELILLSPNTKKSNAHLFKTSQHNL